MCDKCICPEDGREVDSTDRVEYFLPGYIRHEGPTIIRDASKHLIFHKDCPVHGYEFIEEEESGGEISAPASE